jgi:hypothetical protein
MKFIDLKLHIGKRVKLNGRGDLAIHGELRKFIYDDENKYYLVLERVTKGGKCIVRHGKETYSVGCKNVDPFIEAVILPETPYK